MKRRSGKIVMTNLESVVVIVNDSECWLSMWKNWPDFNCRITAQTLAPFSFALCPCLDFLHRAVQAQWPSRFVFWDKPHEIRPLALWVPDLRLADWWRDELPLNPSPRGRGYAVTSDPRSCWLGIGCQGLISDWRRAEVSLAVSQSLGWMA